MALSRTLLQMRDATRQMADVEGTSALDRHPDASVTDYVNRGIAALFSILNETRGGAYYVSTATVSTVAGTSSYALATDFYKLLNINVTIDGRKVWLVPFDHGERAYLSDTNLGWVGEPFRYALRGSNLELLPVPQAVYSVSYDYVPVPPTLSANGDQFDTVERFDDYVVAYAAREVAQKDELLELYDRLTAKLSEIEARVRGSAPNRDQNAPARIVDVSQAYRGYRAGRRWRYT